MKIIPEKEYSFTNAFFWDEVLHLHIQAVDNKREMNFGEIWDDELAPASLNVKESTKYWEELSQSELETVENQGRIENPNTLLLTVNKDITLKMEFHPCYTFYFLNNILIGEISGHFHLRYITYPELLKIAKQKNGDVLFHLLLPMSAIKKQEKELAFNEITKRLKQIPIFQERSDYIGECLLNGLLVPDSEIQEMSEIGTICTANYSYRNALIYGDDVKSEIKKLNILLSKL